MFVKEIWKISEGSDKIPQESEGQESSSECISATIERDLQYLVEEVLSAMELGGYCLLSGT